MFFRLRQFSAKRSFFLFGPRGVGKSTLLKARLDPNESFYLDLLDSDLEDRFLRRPSDLYAIVQALPDKILYVIIDEVQKVPKLLDEVHRLIESTGKIFVLTGSSARKLKHGGANLLAGRAFVYPLHPLSSVELGSEFNLDKILQWGSLPKVFSLHEDVEKNEFLRAYGDTYLKEEIWNEQVIRKLPPFRRFLEVAAQSNGKIINYANIARDVGVDDKTIKEYFCILEDTMIGFFLEPFHHSFRKRLVEKPKFYFFDTGVVRSLSRRLSIPLIPKTAAYGEAFEHFILLEFIRLGGYFQPDYRFSFIRTVSDVEVDLVVERPGKKLLLIEIKSADEIDKADISSFIKFTKDIENAEAIVLSRDRFIKKMDHVTCYPWQEGLAFCFPELKDVEPSSK